MTNKHKSCHPVIFVTLIILAILIIFVILSAAKNLKPTKSQKPNVQATGDYIHLQNLSKTHVHRGFVTGYRGLFLMDSPVTAQMANFLESCLFLDDKLPTGRSVGMIGIDISHSMGRCFPE